MSGDARYVPIWPSTRRSFMYPILMTAKQSYDHTIPRSNLTHTIYIILFTTKFTHVIQYMVISLSKAYPKNSYVELYSPIVFLSRYQFFFRGYRRRRRNRHDHDSRTYWYNSTTKKSLTPIILWCVWERDIFSEKLYIHTIIIYGPND